MEHRQKAEDLPGKGRSFCEGRKDGSYCYCRYFDYCMCYCRKDNYSIRCKKEHSDAEYWTTVGLHRKWQQYFTLGKENASYKNGIWFLEVLKAKVR